MMRIPSSRAPQLRLRLSWFDVAWAIVTPALALLLRDPDTLRGTPTLGVLVYCGVSALLALVFFSLYRIRAPLPSYFAARDAAAIMKAASAMMLATCILVFVLTRLDGVPRSTPVIHWLLLVAGLLAARALGKTLFLNRDLVAEGADAGGEVEQIIVIGANAISAAYLALLDACATRGTQVLAILDPRPQMLGRQIGGVRVLGAPDELPAIVSEFAVHGVRISRVLVAGGPDIIGMPSLAAFADLCGALGVAVDSIPVIAGLAPHPVAAQSAADQRDLEAAAARADVAVHQFGFGARAATRVKRAADVVAVVATLIVMAPLMALIAGAVWFAVGSPVLFWQQRQGRHGRPFHVYKFRTLGAPYAADGRELSAAERRSALGDFLRRMHLDELPQLYSVLTGDMSLVGPRPLLPVDQPDETSLRLSVPPGLTGWAQLNGGKALTPKQKGALDDWYVRNWSLLLDVKILIRTALTLLRGGSHDDFAGDAARAPSEGSGETPRRGATSSAA